MLDRSLTVDWQIWAFPGRKLLKLLNPEFSELRTVVPQNSALSLDKYGIKAVKRECLQQ